MDRHNITDDIALCNKKSYLQFTDHFLYADDLAVIAETEEELIKRLKMNGKITWRVKA